jgi:hypothetical protein
MEYPKLESHIDNKGSRKDPVTKEKRYFTIIDEIRKKQSNAKHKTLVLQKLKFLDNNETQLRLGYYILGKLPRMKGKWTWGQYATFLPIKDFKSIYNKALRKGWLK